MASEKVQFVNESGQKLAAHLELPENTVPVAFAIFAHCFTCSKDYKATYHISKTLSEHGIAVLRFDFTGLGESEGAFESTTFSSNVNDLVSAAGFLENQYHRPDILIGHSLGGAAVLRAAGKITSIKGVATIAAPSNTKHLARILEKRIENNADGTARQAVIGGRRFTISRDLLDDLEKSDMDASISSLGKSLLVFHSPVDKVVLFENAEMIFSLAKQPKSLISLDKADHLLPDKKDAQFIGHIIAAWAHRFV